MGKEIDPIDDMLNTKERQERAHEHIKQLLEQHRAVQPAITTEMSDPNQTKTIEDKPNQNNG